MGNRIKVMLKDNDLGPVTLDTLAKSSRELEVGVTNLLDNFGWHGFSHIKFETSGLLLTQLIWNCLTCPHFESGSFAMDFKPGRRSIRNDWRSILRWEPPSLSLPNFMLIIEPTNVHTGFSRQIGADRMNFNDWFSINYRERKKINSSVEDNLAEWYSFRDKISQYY